MCLGVIDVSALDFGTLAIMPADTDRYGLAKKATQALVNAGIDNETFVTPAQIAARVSTGAVAITGDLNAYTTEGSGYGDASTVTNEPAGTSGSFILDTYKTAATNGFIHEYTNTATLATYTRFTNDGGTTWTAWRRMDADIRVSTLAPGSTDAPDGTIWLDL